MGSGDGAPIFVSPELASPGRRTQGPKNDLRHQEERVYGHSSSRLVRPQLRNRVSEESDRDLLGEKK